MSKYILGPVPSRRLGKSLGIDLIPAKTCTQNCVYCQIMVDTTNKTLNRKEWVPLDEVIEQVKNKLVCEPDIITITGCGETTLFSRLEELIQRLKALTDTKIAVLTNGSLLWMPEVRKELANADIVMPNLDVGDEETYQRVNRPHKGLSFEKLVEGLIHFREEFSKQFWLEIFLLENITAKKTQIEKLQKITEQICPDLIQFNTVTKPTREYCPGSVSKEKMKQYCELFGNKAEIIADYNKIDTEKDRALSKADLSDFLKKGPCTLSDISKHFNLNRMEVIKFIDELFSEEKINSGKRNGVLHYWL